MRWVKIFGSLSEARERINEDKPQLIVVGERRICLVHHNRTFLAVQDSCSHNGESLSKGTINYLGEVICPWHNYRFDLNTGRESDGRSQDLITFPIKIDETGFFIGL
jgi:nitrite reductase/ring-hydroxylating ferredoxin subunit